MNYILLFKNQIVSLCLVFCCLLIPRTLIGSSKLHAALLGAGYPSTVRFCRLAGCIVADYSENG